MNRSFYMILLISFISFDCSNNKDGRGDSLKINDIDPDAVWFDYQVGGEEGNDSVTIKLQFRYNGETGETIALDGSARVTLDGELIKPENSKMTGAYYELRRPVATFTGKHTIVFTGIDGRKFKEEFMFRPLSLASTIPDTIQRADIIFQWNGLNDMDYVRILMTDTVFTSDGIDRLDTVRNGQLIITAADLAQLANGPVHMELIREDIREVENGTFEGGRIAITYGLKREFILED